jgi:voltage-gated potassium channel
MDRYLNAETNYEQVKVRTVQMFDEVRAIVKGRPSMDIVFHSVLVQRMSAFLVRAELTFPAAFYDWMKMLANLYFVLVMLAAPGIVGLIIQIVVIFVFYGLLVIIEDMEFAIDQHATIFNAKIMRS